MTPDRVPGTDTLPESRGDARQAWESSGQAWRGEMDQPEADPSRLDLCRVCVIVLIGLESAQMGGLL